MRIELTFQCEWICLTLPLMVGAHPNGSHVLEGSIEELMLWNSALMNDEVRAIVANDPEPGIKRCVE
ncbi:hypothetical protein [Pajaroellobacter abortibovis]|uniref:hypothetical protein n=1 Tax=Pajaroellobacter abortibovis TaxID=1882918 RepID=UPI0012EB14B3|nr:hypothetical protein [Pajaroellobacter abortibovis]